MEFLTGSQITFIKYILTDNTGYNHIGFVIVMFIHSEFALTDWKLSVCLLWGPSVPPSVSAWMNRWMMEGEDWALHSSVDMPYSAFAKISYSQIKCSFVPKSLSFKSWNWKKKKPHLSLIVTLNVFSQSRLDSELTCRESQSSFSAQSIGPHKEDMQCSMVYCGVLSCWNLWFQGKVHFTFGAS